MSLRGWLGVTGIILAVAGVAGWWCVHAGVFPNPFAVADPATLRANAAQDRGREALKDGEYPAAVEAFSEVLEHSTSEGQRALAHTGRSTAYLNLKEYQKARADLDAAIQLTPGRAPLYQARVICLLRLAEQAKEKNDRELFEKLERQVREDLATVTRLNGQGEEGER
jgi:tetratricopeptide (TPR) repeat protein